MQQKMNAYATHALAENPVSARLANTLIIRNLMDYAFR